LFYFFEQPIPIQFIEEDKGTLIRQSIITLSPNQVI